MKFEDIKWETKKSILGDTWYRGKMDDFVVALSGDRDEDGNTYQWGWEITREFGERVVDVATSDDLDDGPPETRSEAEAQIVDALRRAKEE